MKKIFLIILIFTALAICVWLFFYRPEQVPKQSAVRSAPPQPTNAAAAPIITNAPSQPPSQPVLVTNAFVRPDYIDEDHWNQLMLVRQLALGQNQPIDFYARTLDQNEQPVEGATLCITLSSIDEKIFETTNFFSKKMGDEVVHLPMKLVSDTNGWIRLRGVTGDSLWVESLSKEGYSWTMPQIGSFLYDPNGEHRVGNAGMEDAFNPDKGYVFHMQKTNEASSGNKPSHLLVAGSLLIFTDQ